MPRLSPLLILARYTVIEAWRDRLAHMLLALVAATLAASALLGALAITEEDGVRSVVSAALARAAAVAVIAFAVAASVAREWNDRSIDLLLALPVPRGALLAGRWLGFCLCSIACAALLGLALLPHARAAGVLLWTVSLAFELVLVATCTMFFTLGNGRLASGLAATLGLYVLARALGAMRLMAQAGVAGERNTFDDAALAMVEFLGLLLPRLDMFTQGEWTIDSPPALEALAPVALHSVVFVALLMALTLLDLSRSER